MTPDARGRRPGASSLETAVRYLFPLVLVLVVAAASAWAAQEGAEQEVREGHFRFRLPAEFRPLQAEEIASLVPPDTPWERVFDKRVKDLDRVFVARRGGLDLFVGLKVESYRGRLRKALSFDEFAGPTNRDTFRYALAGQLAMAGLYEVEVREYDDYPEKGILTFICTFEPGKGKKAEEYYLSLLGSHEAVYLVLFASPPAGPGTHAALLSRVLESFQFDPGYGYNPNPQNWWQRRTWTERIEDVTKLAALFFVVYLGCRWGLASLLGSVVRAPWAMQAIVVLTSSVICLLVAKWTLFE